VGQKLAEKVSRVKGGGGEKHGPPYRLLSLDGGGIRGLVLAQVFPFCFPFFGEIIAFKIILKNIFIYSFFFCFGQIKLDLKLYQENRNFKIE
jgi:hypothetical protein